MQKRCVNCMNYIDENAVKCTYCGHIYVANNINLPLEKEYLIFDQYIINDTFYESYEGYTYIGFDQKNDRKVLIKEFFPKELVYRDANNISVAVKNGCEEQFQILYKEFEMLNSKLTKIGSAASIARCYKVFTLNNTVYSIHQYIEGISLQKLLASEFGELNWERTEEMFIPVIYGLNTLNGLGISHLAITPDNLIVENGKTLKITNFCIPMLHVKNKYITPEFYNGFTAPEQYENMDLVGEVSDVYAFCAVLYKCLTGTTPNRSNLRAMNDELISPKGLKQDLPDGVSNAIMQGLKPLTTDRTQSFKDLMKNIYNSTVVVQNHENDRKETPTQLFNIEQNRKQGLKMPVWLLVLLISLPITLAVFALLYVIVVGPLNRGNVDTDISSSLVDSSLGGESSSSGESESSSSQEDSSVNSSDSSQIETSGVEVENFLDEAYDIYANSSVYKELFTFKVTYEYNEFALAGIITKQSIKEGTIVKKGTVIEFVVSKGPKYYTVPQFIDDSGVSVNANEYAAILQENKIPYKLVDEETDTLEPGEIIRLSMNPGSTIDYENLTMITIYVAKAIPIVEEDSSSDEYIDDFIEE